MEADIGRKKQSHLVLVSSWIWVLVARTHRTRTVQKTKVFNDLDNHDSVVTNIQPDNWSAVKWAWGSITMIKASESDRIPIDLFQIIKDDVVKVLHSVCQQIWKTQQWPQDWKRPVSIPIPKDNAKECSNYHTIAIISHNSKIMLKIPQARLQWYVNWELPVVQNGFRKGRGSRNQIANIHWVIRKANEFQKNIFFSLIDYIKPLTVWITTNLENSSRDGNTRPSYLPLEKLVHR